MMTLFGTCTELEHYWRDGAKTGTPCECGGAVLVAVDDADDFELHFWPAYPRKVGKEAARVEWRKTRAARPSTRDLLAALEAQKASPMWKAGRGIPYPATWLHQRRWTDDPAGLTWGGAVALTVDPLYRTINRREMSEDEEQEYLLARFGEERRGE